MNINLLKLNLLIFLKNYYLTLLSLPMLKLEFLFFYKLPHVRLLHKLKFLQTIWLILKRCNDHYALNQNNHQHIVF